MKSLLITLLLMVSTYSWSNSRPATPGNECTGDLMIPSLSCINPVGGTDVRLYMLEFQDCKNDTVTDLDRLIHGLHVVSDRSADDIHVINEEGMEITYSRRLLIDPNNRVDKLSFLMPKRVLMKDGELDIELLITERMELDYPGAMEDQKHFVGSFKITNAQGIVKKRGKLACFVSR